MPKVKAYPIDITTTVLVERTDENGNWVNPLVMTVMPNNDGGMTRMFSLLFSEAKDPWCVPALLPHVIMGEYEITDELAQQYREMVKKIKHKIQMETSGIVAPSQAALRAIQKGNA